MIVDVVAEPDVDDLIKRGRDVWTVVCNYRDPTKIAREGARAFVGRGGSGSGYSDVRVVARSRGGRQVSKWERCKKLTSFRATCVPVEHPMRDRDRHDVWLFPTRGAAEEHAALLVAASRQDATASRARSARAHACGKIAGR